MAASNSPDGAGRDDIPDGTVVTALRAGWNEQLTPEQEYDLIPVTDPDVPRGSEFLRGPLRRVYVDLPDIGEIVVTLVGGQEADPDTIERAEAVANTDQPRDEKGKFASSAQTKVWLHGEQVDPSQPEAKERIRRELNSQLHEIQGRITQLDEFDGDEEDFPEYYRSLPGNQDAESKTIDERYEELSRSQHDLLSSELAKAIHYDPTEHYEPPTHNTGQPRDEKGQFASAGSNIAEDYYAAYAAAYGEGSKGLKPRERTAAVKRYKAALKAWRAAGSPERSAPSPSSAQQGTARPTTTTAATAARIKELAAASRYGTVRVADLHEALGKPDLASLHTSLQEMRRSGAIEMSELEGRGGVDPRDEATALRTPSSRGHEARLGYIDVRDSEAFARHL